MKEHGTKIAAAGTLACALGIGFFMQLGRDVPVAQAPHTQLVGDATPPAASAPADPASIAAQQQAETLSEPSGEEFVALNDVSIASSPLGPNTAATDRASVPATPSDPTTPDLGCDVQAQASVAPDAMVVVDVNAKCFPNERVTLHHNGMVFTQSTDHKGRLSVEIPALSQNAIVIVAFANKKGTVVRADVPDLVQFDRIALQWSGTDGLQIHAREYGAGYGQDGHVWSGSDLSPSAPSRSGTRKVVHGFMTTMGDPDTFAPRMAEVYTFPTATAEKAGTVVLSIEAQVTQSNCDQDMSAQVLRISPNSRLQSRDLDISMPNCTAIGDFLVLNNLVDDLKIAGK